MHLPAQTPSSPLVRRVRAGEEGESMPPAPCIICHTAALSLMSLSGFSSSFFSPPHSSSLVQLTVSIFSRPSSACSNASFLLHLSRWLVLCLGSDTSRVLDCNGYLEELVLYLSHLIVCNFILLLHCKSVVNRQKWKYKHKYLKM